MRYRKIWVFISVRCKSYVIASFQFPQNGLTTKKYISHFQRVCTNAENDMIICAFVGMDSDKNVFDFRTRDCCSTAYDW